MLKVEMNNLVGTMVERKKDGVKGEITGINESGKYVIKLEDGEEKIASASTVERHWKAVEEEAGNVKEEKTVKKEEKAPKQEEKQTEEEVTETPEEKAAREKAEKEAKAKAKAEAQAKSEKEKAELSEKLADLKENIIAALAEAAGEELERHDDKKYAHFKIGKTGVLDVTVLSKAVKFFVLDIDGIDDEKGVFGTSLVSKHGPKAWKVGWGFKVTPEHSLDEIKVVIEKAVEQAKAVEAELAAEAEAKAKEEDEQKAAEKAAKEAEKAAAKEEKAE